jgi:hypothetical protein
MMYFVCLVSCILFFVYFHSISADFVMQHIAGTGVDFGDGNGNGDGGPGPLAAVSNPSAIWSDLNGNVYFTTYGSMSHVRVVDGATGIINTLLGDGGRFSNIDSGPGTAVSLFASKGITGDTLGTFLYVADMFKVWKYEIASDTATLYAGGSTVFGQSGSAVDGSVARDSLFNMITGIWLTDDGTLFVADSGDHVIHKVTTDGILFHVSGTAGVSGYGGDNGPATSTNVLFAFPEQIYVDTIGQIFIAESTHIRKIDSSNILTTFAGGGSWLPIGSGDVAASELYIILPFGIGGDLDGNIFFSDFGNDVVYQVDINNRVTTYIGRPEFQGNNFGISTRYSYLKRPYGVYWNTFNNRMYISEQDGQRVKRSIPDGSVYPTSGPTSSPTSGIISPTSVPSSIPLALPSTIPTSSPAVPTSVPSSVPVSVPSSVPTSAPSVPTSIPSSKPIASPSSVPTGAPAVPTSIPSIRPSSLPSGAPTSSPAVPTSLPSQVPVAEPSAAPSGYPSGVPSLRPSSVPSSLPTSSPASPTSMPSWSPSSTPSSIPSTAPQAFPTSSPTISPQALPSSTPTGLPSVEPSSVPSEAPSSKPSSSPVSGSTARPSGEPSSSPSCFPTSPPTIFPSSTPTGFPSGQPSTTPSTKPTAPSFAPTLAPNANDQVNIQGSVVVTGVRSNPLNNASVTTITQAIANVSNNAQQTTVTSTSLLKKKGRLQAIPTTYTFKVVFQCIYSMAYFPTFNSSYFAEIRTKGIKDAVKNGNFENILKHVAVGYNATQLLDASCDTITLSTTIVTADSSFTTDDKEDKLSAGKIVGVVIGCFVGGFFIFFILSRFYNVDGSRKHEKDDPAIIL